MVFVQKGVYHFFTSANAQTRKWWFDCVSLHKGCTAPKLLEEWNEIGRLNHKEKITLALEEEHLYQRSYPGLFNTDADITIFHSSHC